MLVTVGLLPTPALACTMFWQPLGERLDRLRPGEIPVRADASVAHDIFSDRHRRGTLTLNVRRCLRMPPPGASCPGTLTIAFDEHWEGTECDTPIYGITAMEAPRLRYFLLRHEPDGTWTVLHTGRHLWRP